MLTPSARVFAAMQNLDIASLSNYPQHEIRPVLPSLVRMSLLSPLDNTKSSMESRKQILAILIGIEIVNSIVSYLQVNYHELEIELKKELQARQKSLYIEGQQMEFGLQNGMALGFERADVTNKVHVVLSEIFNVQWQLSEQKTLIHSEILDDGIYLEEVVDILCIALAELPSLLNILDLTDTLVNVQNGKRIICALVSNFPDCFRDVVTHIIMNCDEESNEGKLRLSLLMDLSEMNPSQALVTRAVCVDLLKVPSFMLRLSLNYPQDLVAFLTGMLLGSDQNVRSWLASYVRSSQKRKGDALNLVRSELLKQLQICIKNSTSVDASDDYTKPGAMLLRLFCALRGIAGLKFNDDEINLLSQLITSRPQPTQSGVRFVSLALCMLIACPSLVGTQILENKSVEWLQWLIKEDAFFGKKANSDGSLGEMLLLLAIHFHTNQISAIGDLVCATLAMKMSIRPNSTNRIKQLFTQDLFTEQVIASHAVRVPVTSNLNANIPGYLPVHCIHQLLKSRAFLKHKVPIKAWIYRQICNSVRPLHPVMPALIEVYVTSLITPNPSGKMSIDHMHRPFSENDILHIFRASHQVGAGCDNFYADGLATQVGTGMLTETDETVHVEVQCALTAQLLTLYYLVLYEETRLSNVHYTLSTGRKLKEYSNNFLSELPMKYLIQKAHQHHIEYNGLFHPLLRLIISNYPHLSMIEDWLEEHCSSTTGHSAIVQRKQNDNRSTKEMLFKKAIAQIHEHPRRANRIFKSLLKLPPEELAQYAELIVDNMPIVLHNDVPRALQEMYKDIWLKLNAVLPISFWKMSLNSIIHRNGNINNSTFLNENLLDPLQVLRCGKDVFSSPYILTILLRILQGSLAASKAHLNMHMQSKQVMDKSGQLQSDNDREELKTALIASQESAAVHILLEVLANMKANATTRVDTLNLREIQGIICSFIHQAFISEPSLAKLVHFQTYPREVIPMLVMGVPSLHICIDFLHEFLSMPEMDKQIFTIDLISHLVLKYAIPKCLGISKFCINTIQTTLSLLSTNAKCKYLSEIIPPLIRFAEAFPILVDDCVNILMLTGKSLYSQSTLGINTTQMQLVANSKLKCYKETAKTIAMIEEAFQTLITKIIKKVELY